MLLSIFLALFLPCAGMSMVFVIYICLLWYAASRAPPPEAVKPQTKKGLSPTELEKLPQVTGDKLVLSNECAVCLDEIEANDPARMIPGCNHGFHLLCADTWLAKNPVCPVCRTKLGPEFFDSSQNPC